ncbi:MAG: LamG domain-containing protein [Candidatus Poribacteria bacterium]|nr:LamG domain-containing protein [Candidatus Poribacteria bacterium]
MKALVSATLITAWCAAFYGGYAQAAGIGDIVLAMPFDEGEGEVTMDISPHRNHGTLMENAGWGIGKFGNALQVEPVGYVDAGTDPSLSLFDTDFTLAVWVNMKETVAHQHGFMAQDEGGGPANNKWMLRYNKGGVRSVNFHIHRADGGSMQLEPGFWRANPDTWYQVAVVRAGNEYTFYTDGKRDLELESDLAVAKFIDAPVTVGWAEGPIATDGLIDEALIVKRAFTPDEIKTHFEGGVHDVLAVQPQGKSAAVWGAIKAQILR